MPVPRFALKFSGVAEAILLLSYRRTCADRDWRNWFKMDSMKFDQRMFAYNFSPLVDWYTKTGIPWNLLPL